MTAGFTCAHGHATGHRRLCARACASAAMHARNLFRAGLNTAAWCRGRINGGARVISESQLVSSRGASTTVSIPAEATKAGEGRGPFNAKRLTLYSGAALLAVSSVAAVSAQQRTVKQDAHPSALLEAPWVQAIPQQQDVLQVLSAESIATHPLLSQDHLFTTMLQTGQLEDMVCFYNTEAHKYYTVLQLGKGVCGFPTIVHGGLTATVMDETLGFLLFALKKQQALPFWGPAYTAHLEVDYKAKISSGATILCTAEVESVEGRKLWMKSTVRDGPSGKVYATARALFVAPSMNRLANDAVKLVKDGVFPPKRMGSSM